MNFKRRSILLVISISVFFLILAFAALGYASGQDVDEPHAGSTLSAAGAAVVMQAMPTQIFTDVPEKHPYYDQIQDLATSGIVKGYGGSLFGPDDPLRRQQFAKMIVLTLGLPVSESDKCVFRDVDDSGPKSLYPDNYVAVCAQYGITIGRTSTDFDPFGFVTRQQLVTMVARAAGLPDPSGALPPFGTPQFDPKEHYLNAWKAYQAGLYAGLDGIGKDFNFFGKATRGEVCALLYNLLRSPVAAEGRAIRAAIQDSLGAETHFRTTHLKVSGDWAGAVIMPTDFVADPLQVLLHRVHGVWTVVDYGTGYEAADWMAQGAPIDIAEWLEGLS